MEGTKCVVYYKGLGHLNGSFDEEIVDTESEAIELCKQLNGYSDILEAWYIMIRS